MLKPRIDAILLLAITITVLPAAAMSAACPQEGEEGIRTAAIEEPIPSSAVSYTIQASLDPVEWKIEGRASVSVENRTARATDRVIFQLPLNAYSNIRPPSRSNRAELQGEGNEGDGARLGFMEIGVVSLEEGPAFPEPPEIDGTRMTVHLPSPLDPGGRVKLFVEFTSKLPHRTLGPSGYAGRHVDAVGWYPKVERLTESGWAAHHAHPHPYGYGPFSDYKVTLSLPIDFVVEATGTLIEGHEENALRTVTYALQHALDFVWTADPLYRVEKSIYKNVEIVFLGQPFMEEKVPSLMGTARTCLDRFESSLVPFPFSRLLISTTPYGTGESVSYPMFMGLSQGFPLHYHCMVDKTLDPERTLIKQMAEQYFFGLLACGEGSDSWLSEGLASYVELGSLSHCFERKEPLPGHRGLEQEIVLHLINEGFGIYMPEAGRDAAQDVYQRYIQPFAGLVNMISVAGFRTSPFPTTGGCTPFGYLLDPLLLPGWDFEQQARVKAAYLEAAGKTLRKTPDWKQFPERYAGLGASRATLALKTLHNHMGAEKMKTIIKTYVERHRFSRPGTDDFLAVVLEVGGKEMADMAEVLFLLDGVLDYTIESARCWPLKKARGFVTQRRAGERIEEDFSEPRDADPEGGERFRWDQLIRFGAAGGDGGQETAPEPSPSPSPVYQWEVIVGNRGDMALPVTVLLSFESGKTERRSWDGKGGLLCLQGEGPDRLVAAAADPAGRYPLDLNRLNNMRAVRSHERGVFFLAGWTNYWIQNYLNGWAFFN